MPQLDPAPWFLVLTLSWSIFLIIIPPIILAHTFPNDPQQKSTKKPTTDHWDWPWQ